MAPLYPNNSNNNDVSMNAYPSEAINNGAYENGFEWEFSAMSGEVNMGQDMDAAITPGTWNSMLESVMENVPQGWDVLGTPHGANIDVPGSGQK